MYSTVKWTRPVVRASGWFVSWTEYGVPPINAMLSNSMTQPPHLPSTRFQSPGGFDHRDEICHALSDTCSRVHLGRAWESL
eukprot:scaffold550101_cov50-Prasinocladus_malaysianus.AAC.3